MGIVWRFVAKLTVPKNNSVLVSAALEVKVELEILQHCVHWESASAESHD